MTVVDLREKTDDSIYAKICYSACCSNAHLYSIKICVLMHDSPATLPEIQL